VGCRNGIRLKKLSNPPIIPPFIKGDIGGFYYLGAKQFAVADYLYLNIQIEMCFNFYEI